MQREEVIKQSFTMPLMFWQHITSLVDTIRVLHQFYMIPEKISMASLEIIMTDG